MVIQKDMRQMMQRQKLQGSAFYVFCVAPRAGEADPGDKESKEGSSDQESDKKDQESKDKDGDQESRSDKGKESYSRSEVEAIRREAAKHRTDLRDAQKQLNDVQTKLKEFEDKGKTDLEKATDEVKYLNDQVKVLSRKSFHADGVSAAVRNRAIDPDVVARLVDPDSDEKIDQQIEALKISKPFLFSTNGDSDGGKGGERGRERQGKVSMNDLIRGNR